MKYFLYGEVFFSSTQRRTTAARRLDNRVAAGGWAAEVWDQIVLAYGSWPAGRTDVTRSGAPGFRFCYSTTDGAAATSAVDDIRAAWDVFQDSDSWYGYAGTV